MVVVLAAPTHQFARQSLGFMQVVRVVAEVGHAVEDQQVWLVSAEYLGRSLLALVRRQLPQGRHDQLVVVAVRRQPDAPEDPPGDLVDVGPGLLRVDVHDLTHGRCIEPQELRIGEEARSHGARQKSLAALGQPDHGGDVAPRSYQITP